MRNDPRLARQYDFIRAGGNSARLESCAARPRRGFTMRSIRLSLIFYFLVLLTLALAAVSWFSY
jgi:hypothetical protein